MREAGLQVVPSRYETALKEVGIDYRSLPASYMAGDRNRKASITYGLYVEAWVVQAISATVGWTRAQRRAVLSTLRHDPDLRLSWQAACELTSDPAPFLRQHCLPVRRA